jgi:hypothetical protein
MFTVNPIFLKKAILSSLWKALLVAVLFLLLGLFQNKNIVREQLEDFGFDVINQILISSRQEVGGRTKNDVTVFAFDNAYMRQYSLYDEDGVSTFGSIFPRQHIVVFFDNLDRHLLHLARLTGVEGYCPKAVFVDIDTSYPSGANAVLSEGDKQLIQTLSKPRCYKILLARGSKYNFIESAAKSNPSLQAQLDSQSLMFVSPNFHQGNDDIVRRNEPVKTINDIPYLSAAIALWQIIKRDKTDLAQAHEFINDVKQAETTEKETKKRSHRLNVNANRIWMRNYNYPHQTTSAKQPCGVNSYWDNLKKYSLSCSFKGFIPSPEYFNGNVLMLGSTEVENSDEGLGRNDYHKIPDILVDKTMSGVDIHANSLMTLLHLDAANTGLKKLPQLMQLAWFKSLSIVFFTFFLVYLFITWLLQVINIQGVQTIFLISAVTSSAVFFAISLALINSSQPVWFNWVVGVILVQIVEVVLLLRNYLPLFAGRSIIWLSRAARWFGEWSK